MTLTPKIALVSGGNRGIGRAICSKLIQKGYTVLVGSRDLNLGNIAVQELNRELSGAAYPKAVQLDLDDEESLKTAALFIEKTYGKLDLLINNAAKLPNGDNSIFVDTETVKSTMQTNVFGVLKLTQLCLPLLRKSTDARIINVSSGMGSFSEGGPAYAAYRLSKSNLNFLTFMMAKDLENEPRLKVFAACPGWVKTDMGGANAPRTPEEGADSILWPAFSNEALSGTFYRDGIKLNW